MMEMKRNDEGHSIQMQQQLSPPHAFLSIWTVGCVAKRDPTGLPLPLPIPPPSPVHSHDVNGILGRARTMSRSRLIVGARHIGPALGQHLISFTATHTMATHCQAKRGKRRRSPGKRSELLPGHKNPQAVAYPRVHTYSGGVVVTNWKGGGNV
jgi:hypothetical protein